MLIGDWDKKDLNELNKINELTINVEHLWQPRVDLRFYAIMRN